MIIIYNNNVALWIAAKVSIDVQTAIRLLNAVHANTHIHTHTRTHSNLFVLRLTRHVQYTLLTDYGYIILFYAILFRRKS